MRSVSGFVVGIIVFTLPMMVAADIIHVPGDQATIQAGINAASEGDIVLVADGVYSGNGNRDLVLGNAGVTVKSENGPENCIIDCQGSYYDKLHRGFNISADGCSVIGLSIINGVHDVGGAIWISSTSTISNNIIAHNIVSVSGGGIHSSASSIIVNNIIRNNTSHWMGGGIGIVGESPVVINNTIINNTATSNGGGIHNNETNYPTILNCIIRGNTPNQLEGNVIVSHSNIQANWPGTGNINANPLFTSGPFGNYYLSQIASGQGANSPCVDAGDPTSEMISGTTRTDEYPDTGIIDMGYHYPTSTYGVELIDIDPIDNFMATTPQEQRNIFQRFFDDVVSVIPGSDPDQFTSTDITIRLLFSNSELISSVSGHIDSSDNPAVIGWDYDFELMEDGYYELKYRGKNILELSQDLFSLWMGAKVKMPGTGGDLPPLSGAAPTYVLETVALDLTTGSSVEFPVNEVLNRFDVALGNQIDEFRYLHFFTGFNRFAVASPVDLLVEDEQGHKLGTENGQTYFDIPYSIYSGDSEPEMIMVFGDDIYSATIEATAAGSFDLTVNQNVVHSQSDGLEAIFDNVTIQDVSTGWIDGGLGLDESEYLLEMDYSGSGSVEEVLDPTTITSDLMAYFAANTTQGYHPLTVQFTDQSLGDPVSWQWDIDNDGSFDYTDQNPTHTYDLPGTYTVSLSVTDGGGLSNEETKSDYITATCSLIAAESDNPWSIEVVNTLLDIVSLGFDIHYNGAQRSYQGFYTTGCLTNGWATFECEDLGCVGDDCTLRFSGSNATPIPAGSSGYLIHLFFEDLDGQTSQICLDTLNGDISQYETDCGSICGDHLPVQPLISADMTCTPHSGTVPFDTNFDVSLSNLDSWRPASRLSAHIDLVLANGQSFSNWRRGWTNITAGSSFSTAWNQNIPSTGTVIGDNVFTLIAEDVTPSPWNQPPYPPSGSTDTSVCTVTGVAP